MTRMRVIGVVVFTAGLFLNNYGFLHDVVWAKHDGAIFMGPRSYLLVFAGVLLMIAGMGSVWRARKV